MEKYLIVIFILFFSCLSFSNQAYSKKVVKKTVSSEDIEKEFVEIISYMNTLLEVTQKYDKKHGENLPIMCSNCKKRALSLGEFSGGLIGKALTDVAKKKDFAKLKQIFEDLIKLLSSDAPESEMADFVLNEVRNIDYHCTECHKVSWGKVK